METQFYKVNFASLLKRDKAYGNAAPNGGSKGNKGLVIKVAIDGV